jgi:hypothetical protein
MRSSGTGNIVSGWKGKQRGRRQTFAADAFPEFSGEFELLGILLEVVDVDVAMINQ